MIKKIICDKRFIWNPSNCECECDKLCDVGEYLHYPNFKCRKRLIDKLVEECSENIDENKLISVTLNDCKNVCGSRAIYIVSLVILFIINLSINCAFAYFYITNVNTNTEIVIY